MMRTTIGRASGATSTRSSPDSSAIRRASSIGTTPTCSPSAPMRRTGLRRICWFTRTLSSMQHLLEMTRREPTSRFERKTSRNIAPGTEIGDPPLFAAPPLVGDRDHRVDTPSDEEVTDHLEEARTERRDEVVENEVRHGFVKMPFVAIRPEVELQRFQLHTGAVGDVADADRREIGLTRPGAQTGELRAGERDRVVPLGLRVRERLE